MWSSSSKDNVPASMHAQRSRRYFTFCPLKPAARNCGSLTAAAREGVGFSFHETNIPAGTTNEFWYANHIECVYCVGGEGELLDRETGETYEIRDGMCYLLDKHDRHTVTATTDLRLICTFNPPVTGREVHDENGVYPLLTEPKEVTA